MADGEPLLVSHADYESERETLLVPERIRTGSGTYVLQRGMVEGRLKG